MLKPSYPYYLANRAVAANQDLEIRNKYTGESATKVALADTDVIEKAIAASVGGFEEFRHWPSHRRQAVLAHLEARMVERREELAQALCIEAGKAIRDSRVEVDRGIDTAKIAKEEATRIGGEVMPLDSTARSEGYRGLWSRVPIGPCSFISPFNFPINLAMHKIAPALAVGCSFVLKPASATPVSALIIGDILSETDLPAGTFSILPSTRAAADLLTTDDRLKLLSFTGSPEVGWNLKAKAGKKKVVLELGGNAACVVDEGADVKNAVDRIIFGAFYQSGQSCISVQRIYCHESLYGEFREVLRERVAGLKSGDPLKEDTFMGPLITEKDAQRIESWVNNATAAGAQVLVGGSRNGVFYDATVVENVPLNAELTCQEAFGPVATLESFSSFDDVLNRVNHGDFGLQAGIFTNNLEHAWLAFDSLDVGGVVVNDVPSFRVDQMPYGGVKDSGLGREGIRFAIEDMTEIRLMVMKDVGAVKRR